MLAVVVPCCKPNPLFDKWPTMAGTCQVAANEATYHLFLLFPNINCAYLPKLSTVNIINEITQHIRATWKSKQSLLTDASPLLHCSVCGHLM